MILWQLQKQHYLINFRQVTVPFWKRSCLKAFSLWRYPVISNLFEYPHLSYEKGKNQERVAPWKLRQTYLYIQTLINVHIKELLKNPEATYNADSPLIKKIIALATIPKLYKS